MDKYSFFAVKFDHETKTFDFDGGLIDGIMGGCMLVIDDDNDKDPEWKYPETEEEIELDRTAERKLYEAMCRIQIDTP